MWIKIDKYKINMNLIKDYYQSDAMLRSDKNNQDTILYFIYLNNKEEIFKVSKELAKEIIIFLNRELIKGKF